MSVCVPSVLTKSKLILNSESLLLHPPLLVMDPQRIEAEARLKTGRSKVLNGFILYLLMSVIHRMTPSLCNMKVAHCVQFKY